MKQQEIFARWDAQYQEVDTVTSQILIGAPNTIKEEIIKQTLDKELKNIKQILLKNDKEYKLTREQSNNWIRYAVMRDFPAGMPWEGTEGKKQKQGTSNARLAIQQNFPRQETKNRLVLSKFIFACCWKSIIKVKS